MIIMEEIVYFEGPNGQSFKCVKSQVQKMKGKDPWGSEMTAEQKKFIGV